MSNPRDLILQSFELGFPWVAFDPFLFCVHHEDHYPRGNDALGPAGSLTGRNIGNDFTVKDGWRMYHGDVVPGFPRHPHRGFETVTIARRGYIDHSDSLGATARFGHGDVQWMTAGRGIVHSEMFPLIHGDAQNPVELFQIWINLSAANKMVEPHFSMLWDHTIPKVESGDVEIRVVAGALGGAQAPPPPPKSWAAAAKSDVAIWTIKLSPGGRVTLPSASADANRAVYVFRGKDVALAGQPIDAPRGFRVRADVEAEVENRDASEPVELLVLQGRPIGEPVVQHGPFVMNTRAEIQQTMVDFRRTQFGGWPWGQAGPVHAREAGRFAIHADGRREDAG